MFKKISYFACCAVVSILCVVPQSFAEITRKPLAGLRYKDLPHLVKCDSRFVFFLPGSGIKRTMALTPAMSDVLEAGRFTTASIRLPFSGHMVHTLGLAPGSSKTIGYGAVDEHLEITVTRHNPSNTGEDLIALPAETSQAGLSSSYVAAETMPNFYPGYFHEFLDVSNWIVEFNCAKRLK